MDRILDIDSAAFLRVRLDCLVVERDGVPPVVVPGSEIAVLVLSSRDITLTSSVLALLAGSDVAVMSLNSKYMPVGMMLPIAANSRHTERLRFQIAQTDVMRTTFWRTVVEMKIEAQAKHLDDQDRKHSLRELDLAVPEYAEAHAARLYWQALFGPEFSRRDDDDEVNSLLNYGYAIVRSLTARAICKAGLHPAIGVHHKNQYNPFVLADDLMEPFRPVIDRVAITLGSELTKEAKRELLAAAMGVKVDVEALVQSYLEVLAR
jgi:CRISPR-associated protein Cas1